MTLSLPSPSSLTKPHLNSQTKTYPIWTVEVFWLTSTSHAFTDVLRPQLLFPTPISIFIPGVVNAHLSYPMTHIVGVVDPDSGPREVVWCEPLLLTLSCRTPHPLFDPFEKVIKKKEIVCWRSLLHHLIPFAYNPRDLGLESKSQMFDVRERIGGTRSQRTERFTL